MKGALTIEDLRIDPDELHRFADQLHDLPPPRRGGGGIPSFRLGKDIYLRPTWNDGPMVTLEIRFP